MSQRLFGAALAVMMSSVSAHAGDLTVVEAWTRPTFAGAPNAVGYLRIVNRGAAPDRLLGGSTPAAAGLEIHRTTAVGGVVRMRAVVGGAPVPARGATVFEPNGYHLMFVSPRRAFRLGDRVPATLRFERAGALIVRFDVRNGPGTSMPAGMAMH